jgi:hypothetical protein
MLDGLSASGLTRHGYARSWAISMANRHLNRHLWSDEHSQTPIMKGATWKNSGPGDDGLPCSPTPLGGPSKKERHMARQCVPKVIRKSFKEGGAVQDKLPEVVQQYMEKIASKQDEVAEVVRNTMSKAKPK